MRGGEPPHGGYQWACIYDKRIKLPIYLYAYIIRTLNSFWRRLYFVGGLLLRIFRGIVEFGITQ